jgi:acetyl-CoA carboxylase carboxyltransferase component
MTQQAPAENNTPSMSDYVDELEERKARALQMGGADKVARQHGRGRLTARERVELLVDPGSFTEVGLLAHSDLPEAETRTPADGKVAGIARIDGRMVVVSATDVTVLAGAAGRVASRKSHFLARLAFDKGYPIIKLDEGGGARVPDILGSDGILASDSSPADYSPRRRRVPMVTAILGDGFGETAWDSAYSDFVVQRKGTAMAVSGPRALEVATSERATEEELGGWELHARVTGLVDMACDEEAECLDAVRRFLSYLPSHCEQLPPRAAGDPEADARQGRLEEIVPVQPRRAYGMHKVLEVLFDAGSLFEVKPLLDRSVVTALARLDGAPVGVMASNPMFNGGALGALACDKMTALIALCDSFHLPLVMLSDTPGFFVGRKAEEAGVSGRIVRQWMALAEATVPKISVVLRKGYGGGYFSLGAHGMNMDFNLAWPTADIGFVAPEVATNIAHARRIAAADDPEALRASLTEDMRRASAPWRAAGRFLLHDVIRPRDTRAALLKCIDIARGARRGGFSERRLASWPTTF